MNGQRGQPLSRFAGEVPVRPGSAGGRVRSTDMAKTRDPALARGFGSRAGPRAQRPSGARGPAHPAPRAASRSYAGLAACTLSAKRWIRARPSVGPTPAPSKPSTDKHGHPAAAPRGRPARSDGSIPAIGCGPRSSISTIEHVAPGPGREDAHPVAPPGAAEHRPALRGSRRSAGPRRPSPDPGRGAAETLAVITAPTGLLRVALGDRAPRRAARSR